MKPSRSSSTKSPRRFNKTEIRTLEGLFVQTRRTRLLGGAFATTRECRETRLCGCLRWRVRLPSAESLKSPRRCCRSRSATQNSGFSKAFQRFLPACCVSASQFAFTRGRLRQRLRGAMTRAPCGYDHAHRPQSLTHMDHGPWTMEDIVAQQRTGDLCWLWLRRDRR